MSDHAILTAWDIGSVHTLTPAGGTINRTMFVEAAGGRFVLRAYRHSDRRRVEWEHAIIEHARSQGIPAPAPMATIAGSTIHQQAAHFYALFPHAPGQHLHEDSLDEQDCATLGSFLARLHGALRDFSPVLTHERSLQLDTAAADHALALLESLARARGDEPVLRRITSQRAWLVEAPPELFPLKGVERQVIHGDYQLANLLFLHGDVSAIIDWDQAYAAPRAWEVVRTIDLVFRFIPRPTQRFLNAYRATQPLDHAELDAAARWYSQVRAHDSWLYKALLVDGNERVRKLIPDEPFQPLLGRWNALASALVERC